MIGAKDRKQEGDAFLRRLEADDLAFGAGEDPADHAGLRADLQLFVEHRQDGLGSERIELVDHRLLDVDRPAFAADEVEYAAGTADRRLELHRVEACEHVAREEGFDDDLVFLVTATGATQAREDQLRDADGPQVLHRHRLLARLGLDAEPGRADGFGHALLKADFERSGSQPSAMSANWEGTKT